MENKFKNNKFQLNDLLLIALIAAGGTAIKVVVGIIVRTITSSLGIPGGAVAGGFYMLWLALGAGLIKKFGTATLISLIQSLMIFFGGLPGSHGIITFLTYMAPAVLVDIVFLFSKDKKYNILHYIISTMLANMAGTFGTNLVFFRLSLLPLLFVIVSAALSGLLGGVIAYLVIKKINEKPNHILKRKAADNQNIRNAENNADKIISAEDKENNENFQILKDKDLKEENQKFENPIEKDGERE